MSNPVTRQVLAARERPATLKGPVPRGWEVQLWPGCGAGLLPQTITPPRVFLIVSASTVSSQWYFEKRSTSGGKSGSDRGGG